LAWNTPPLTVAYMQAELEADGVGDHIFLLRLAEMLSQAHLRQDLTKTLRLNVRALSFAHKVRGQLSDLVKERIWPLYVEGRHDSAKRLRRKRARSISPVPAAAAACQVVDGQSGGHKQHSSELRMPSCPSLGHDGSVATLQDIECVRHALAIGYAPRVAMRMPLHNGYRTITARKPSIACAPFHSLLYRLAA
jgi:hypothetical protein